MEHDRFILGQGESGRLYITHTQKPRFVAEFDPDAPAVGDAIAVGEGNVSNFVWIDPVNESSKAQLAAMMIAAIAKINS